MRHHDFRSPRHRQRGAALLTAMIIVTLVATLATAMVWQQWRAVQVETAERARTQATWVLSGALDFARRILREDKTNYTGLTEPWATPLAESRLSTFLAVEGADPDDGPEAFLSGYITDANSRYNVSNLVTTDKVQQAWELETLTLLCKSANISDAVAQQIATGLTQASASTATGAMPLKPSTVKQLAWLGVDPDSLKALEPYIVVLPEQTTLNVNTASKEVLAAVLHIDASTAGRLVQMALQTPFKDPATFATQLGTTTTTAAKYGTFSNYFEVHGKIRLADRVLMERSLLQRNAQTRISKVLDSERVSSIDQAGTDPTRPSVP